MAYLWSAVTSCNVSERTAMPYNPYCLERLALEKQGKLHHLLHREQMLESPCHCSLLIVIVR